MSRKARIPNCLEYVRTQRKLSKAAVARELNTSVQKLEKFEQGEATPTPRQFSALQRMYGVADFLLASENKPNLEPLPVDFRKENSSEIETGPKGLAAYFDRLEHASVLSSLAGALNEEPRFKLPKLNDASKLPELARTIATTIQFDPTDFNLVSQPALALRRLRYSVEGANLFCFLVQVPPVDYRGAYTKVDDDWGMCLVNKRTFLDKARMFTIAHELAHYLVGAEGVSDPLITRNILERYCNRFASRLLAPEDQIRELWRDAEKRYIGNAERINYVSSHTLLSKGASAYRLLDDDVISKRVYQAWFNDNNFPADYGAEDTADDLSEASGGGGQWAYNVISDFGYRPIQILREAIDAELIDEIDASRILNARGDSLEQVFSTVTNRTQELDADV